MTNLPPPRPGYHRDAHPEGEWGPDYTEDREEIEGVQLGSEYEFNWPAIVVTLILLTPMIPINIILWRWAL